jgi:hypothetical protein
MDPVRNPYAPGAGNPPPELAGRSDVLNGARTAILRTAQNRACQSMILVGLRGVGKTVLLNKIDQIAEEHFCFTAYIEAHEGKSLPELLVPELRKLLYSLSKIESAKEATRKGLRILKSFLSGLKVTIDGVDIGIDPELGVAAEMEARVSVIRPRPKGYRVQLLASPGPAAPSKAAGRLIT